MFLCDSPPIHSAIQEEAIRIRMEAGRRVSPTAHRPLISPLSAAISPAPAPVPAPVAQVRQALNPIQTSPATKPAVQQARIQRTNAAMPVTCLTAVVSQGISVRDRRATLWPTGHPDENLISANQPGSTIE